MSSQMRLISAVLLLAAVALAGCGSNSSASGRRIAKIPFASPAISGTALPARYTCDGKDISPPLVWGEVPAGVHDLAVFILGLTPTASGGSAISVEWALANINPALHKLAAGRVPHGAHLGIRTDGKKRYSICPEKGTGKRYEFGIYAVPNTVNVPSSYVGLQLLGGIASTNAPDPTTAGGEFTVAYQRK